MSGGDKVAKYPKASKKEHVTQIHGRSLMDPYFWLRDKQSEEVMNHLKAENEYTQAKMAHTLPDQEFLYQEMLGRIKETDMSVPVKIDDYFYYSRTEKGKQYSIQCRKQGGMDSEEQVLLDLNDLAQGRAYFRLGIFSISEDHNLLAYGADTEGSETYTLRFKNLKSGEVFGASIENCATDVEWSADNQFVFYNTLDDAKRPYKVFRHRVGQGSSAEDVLIYHEQDEGFFLSVDKTKDRKFILLDFKSNTTSEVRYLDANDPEGEFQLFEKRRPRIEYYVEHHGADFLILTNDEAQNFRLMKTPDHGTGRTSWKEIVSHRSGVRLEDFEVFRNHVVLYERSEGLPQIRVFNKAMSSDFYIEFPESVYTAWGGSNPEYESEVLRFGYTSLITPRSVFDFDLNTREQKLLKQMEVLGGYDRGKYVTERVYAVSHDGVSVPMSVVYRKDLAVRENNPLFLYGYGSYGITIDPEFSSLRLSLLDRGIVFVIAHIRGGGYLGRAWYDDGKLLKKKNTFEDFIACAEHLIEKGFTSPEKLVISGGSAGGLLMGAVLNARPDLFLAAIAQVPFVDVINTMLDATLPLTVIEYEEWGNPQDKRYFEYISEYSPYDNVKKTEYPHILIMTGVNDPRVQYWEPVKWAARLRELKTDDKDLLVKINMGAGHSGASGRYDYLKEVAFEYAFVFDKLAIKIAGPERA